MRHGMYDKKIERAMLSARAFRSDKSAILAAIPIALPLLIVSFSLLSIHYTFASLIKISDEKRDSGRY